MSLTSTLGFLLLISTWLSARGFILFNSNYAMPYWFDKASKDQNTSNISYPFCVNFESGASDPDGIAYEHYDQYFQPNIDMITEQFNKWIDSMQGFPYGWNVNLVTFYIVGDSTTCPELDNDLEPVKVYVRGPNATPYPISADIMNHRFMFNAQATWSQGDLHWATVLHETGHLMGLGDNYKCNWLLGGRPKAIMNTGIAVLEDDIQGLLALWQRMHDNTISICGDMETNGYFAIPQFVKEDDNVCCFPKIHNTITDNIPDNCIALFEDINFENPIGQEFIHLCHNNNEAIAVFLPNIEPESIFIGDNVHLQVRGLTNINKENIIGSAWNYYDYVDNKRYVVVYDMQIEYPAAEFYTWMGFDRENVNAFYILISPKDMQFNSENIPEINLDLSRKYSGTNWPDSNIINNILTQNVPQRSCNGILQNHLIHYEINGIYLISMDYVSDALVYCDMTTGSGGWTYIGYHGEHALTVHFWTKSLGIYQTDPTHENIDPDSAEMEMIIDMKDIHNDRIKYQRYGTRTYSNGLAAKLDDTEMMIITKHFDARSNISIGYPKFFLKYNYDLFAFNNYYIGCPWSTETIQMKYGKGNIDNIISKNYEDVILGCYDGTTNVPWVRTSNINNNNDKYFQFSRYWSHGLEYIKGGIQHLNAWIFIKDSGLLPYNPSSLTPPVIFYLVKENSACAWEPWKFIDQFQPYLTPLECAEKCKNNSACATFGVGRNDGPGYHIGRCYLYNDYCKYEHQNIFNVHWNMYSMSKPPTYLYRGGCADHFVSGMFVGQYKDITLFECSNHCMNKNNCKSFTYGRSDDTTGRIGWCNLYSDICTQGNDLTWDTYLSN